MRLVVPTDFQVLEAFDETGRNTAPNIAIHTGKDKNYLNTRLPLLADDGYLEKIGPAEKSGLYEITEKGKRAIKHRDLYQSDRDRFESLVEAADS